MGAVSKPPARKGEDFDPTKIMAMLPPLTVRVEKVRGTQKTPIDVPSPGGEGFNSGFAPEHILGLETWLCNEGGGGGFYKLAVWDQQGAKHEWHTFFDPRQHPERTPSNLYNVTQLVPQQPPPQQVVVQQPMLVSVPMPMPQQVQQPSQVQQPQTFATPPWPPPQTHQGPQPQPAPVVQPQAQPVQQMSIPYNPYGYAPQPQPQTYAAPLPIGADPDRRRAEEDRKRLEAELAEVKRKQADDAFQARFDKMQADHARQLDELKRSLQPPTDPRLDRLEQMIARMAERPSGPNPEIEALKEQNRRLEAERAQDARDAALQDTLARQQQAMQAQISQLAAAAQPRGVDPMVTLLIETMKDNGRATQSALEALKGGMMSPRDILQIAKDSSGGVDVATKSMLGNFSQMFEMQQKLVEYAMQATSSGEGPVVSTIKDAIAGVKEYGERYAIGKSKENVAQAQAAQAQAEEQVERIRAQQRQMEMMAQREAALAEAEAAARSGRPAPRPFTAEPAPAAAAGNPLAGAATPAVAPASIGVKRKGRTDEEWFGAAMVEVERLRMGAGVFVESAQRNPPRVDAKTGQIVGTTPDQAAEGLLRAVKIVVENEMDIPAFKLLFLQQAYADFLDVLLPDVPQIYRDDVALALQERLRGVAGHAVNAASPTAVDELEDDEEDEDDDQDDSSDADGVVHANGAASALAPRAAIVPAPRAAR